ncbi:hypothetical protein Tco_1108877 [Tanacetum coccineum]
MDSGIGHMERTKKSGLPLIFVPKFFLSSTEANSTVLFILVTGGPLQDSKFLDDEIADFNILSDQDIFEEGKKQKNGEYMKQY